MPLSSPAVKSINYLLFSDAIYHCTNQLVADPQSLSQAHRGIISRIRFMLPIRVSPSPHLYHKLITYLNQFKN